MYLKTQKDRRQLRLCVTQKDQRPLLRLQAALGLGSVYGPYESQKGMSHWVVSCANAEAALALLWPYLSEPKREQAERAVVAWKENEGRKKRVGLPALVPRAT